MQPQGYLFGLLSAFLSALAAVYTEWVMKRNNDSLYWQVMPWSPCSGLSASKLANLLCSPCKWTSQQNVTPARALTTDAANSSVCRTSSCTALASFSMAWA